MANSALYLIGLLAYVGLLDWLSGGGDLRQSKHDRRDEKCPHGLPPALVVLILMGMLVVDAMI
jgi:hypothetical protein